MTEHRMVGPVDLRVPPDPTLSRILRLAASGMATLAEFTVAEIEDIKIAVSEVFLALIEHGDGEPIDVQFLADAQVFTVRARTAVVAFDVSHPDLLLCRTVLSGVCADHEIELLGRDASITAHVARSTID